MTKLEEKLIELGYEQKYRRRKKYSKHFTLCELIICPHKEEIADFYIDINITIDNQYQIDVIQQAFNEMQKDLEVLKNDN